MARLVVFGAGDIARLAHHYFSRDSRHEVMAFAVDASHRRANEFLGLPLIDAEALPSRYPPSDFKMFCALSYAGMNTVRESKVRQVKAMGYELVSYVSSRCTWLTDSSPGENCLILEDNTIQPFARIGNNVTLWSGNHIGHDSAIEDHCFITSHVVVSGNVRVGHHTFIGVNATLRNSITIGPRTLVGAGAAIMENTAEASIYVPPRAVRLDKTSDQIQL
jgi:sugar O-acyltransferase (sialic acid O-acetyltransferase NeuD family)